MEAIKNSDQQEVILKMKIENKKGKHYICLDRPEYTLYPDEREILIQSGLKAKIESIELNNDDITIISLFISDKMVKREKRKRTLDYAWPFLIISLQEIL